MACICSTSSSCWATRIRLRPSRRRWAAPVAAYGQESHPQDERFDPDSELKEFLRKRKGTGDFISRASDVIWRNELLEAEGQKTSESLAQENQKFEDTGATFLKLIQDRNWNMSMDAAAPTNAVNAVPVTNAARNLLERELTKGDLGRRGWLQYEALKRELSLLTATIGAASTLYCLLVYPVQAAGSYVLGVSASLIYWQLLGYHTERISPNNVPQVFMKKKYKYKKKSTGVTSMDVRDSLLKTLQGIRLSVTSPRLLIPIGLYALWLASIHLNDKSIISFKLEITPMMLGFFAYKAAAIVQLYRENKDVAIDLPLDTGL